MMSFEVVRYKNFISSGNVFTEIRLNKHKSTLIIGENGAGKSTVLEAISFALYGKPMRNINRPQLVNSITQKNMTVELEFSIASKKYLVRRGLKPAIFEIFLNGTSQSLWHIKGCCASGEVVRSQRLLLWRLTRRC